MCVCVCVCVPMSYLVDCVVENFKMCVCVCVCVCVYVCEVVGRGEGMDPSKTMY